MPGCSIHRFSFEILVLIVTFYRIPTCPCCGWYQYGLTCEPNDIRDLSLVCKAFNDACSTFLFRYYPLFLRDKESLFDREWALERIAVLSRKSPYVRFLYLSDRDYTEIGDDAEAIPEEVIPDLMTALETTTGITKIALDCRGRVHPRLPSRIPSPLWNWVRDRGRTMKTIILKGWWIPPEQAEPIDNVEKLVIKPMIHMTKITKLIKAPSLLLLSKGRTDFESFIPLEHLSHLRQIYIRFDGDWIAFCDEAPGALFDFSSVPLANIVVEICATDNDEDSEDNKEDIEDAMKMLFGDQLEIFDVKCADTPEVRFRASRKPISTSML